MNDQISDDDSLTEDNENKSPYQNFKTNMKKVLRNKKKIR
jgi:hypothetical protein